MGNVCGVRCKCSSICPKYYAALRRTAFTHTRTHAHTHTRTHARKHARTRAHTQTHTCATVGRVRVPSKRPTCARAVPPVTRSRAMASRTLRTPNSAMLRRRQAAGGREAALGKRRRHPKGQSKRHGASAHRAGHTAKTPPKTSAARQRRRARGASQVSKAGPDPAVLGVEPKRQQRVLAYRRRRVVRQRRGPLCRHELVHAHRAHAPREGRDPVEPDGPAGDAGPHWGRAGGGGGGAGQRGGGAVKPEGIKPADT
jgi:hypothetical protein